jgi:hypothetical protein
MGDKPFPVLHSAFKTTSAEAAEKVRGDDDDDKPLQ